MRDPKQKMRFSDDELSLVKGLFSDDAEILYTVRKVMFQFDLDAKEKESLKSLSKPAIDLIRKFLKPGIESDAPLFQLAHMALQLGADTKSLSPEGAWPFIQAKKLEMEYLEQQLQVLEGGKSKPKIILSDLVEFNYGEGQKEEAWINFTAWNYLFSYMDSNFAQMKMLAGQKTESVEDTKKRLERDSSK